MDFYKEQSTFQLISLCFLAVMFVSMCLTLCTSFYRWWKKRQAQRRLVQAASARALEPPASAYVIPVSQAQEQHHGPPQYNLPQQYPPPPAHNELMPKPDFPRAPPPVYTEVTNPSALDQITPSYPPLPQ